MKLHALAALTALAATAHAQCPLGSTPSVHELVAIGVGLGNGDQFGRAVDIDGDVAVVGAWLKDLFVPADNTGAAYVFEREQGCWVLKQELIMPAGVEQATAVAVSGDRILISSWKEFSASLGSTGPGSVYVFEKEPSGCWQVKAKLEPDPADSNPWDFFSVSLDLEGDRALIGAREDDAAGGDIGAAYVFDYAGGAWTQTQKLLPTGGSGGNLPSWFGNFVSLSGDRALIGEWVTTCEPLPANCQTCINFDCPESCHCDTGRAHVFDLVGGQWQLSATLVGADLTSGDGYGSVALDGDVAVVGAYEGDDGCAGSPADCNSGAAYVLERDGGGNWNQTAKLTASDADGLDNFGYAVDVAGDTIAVSARLWDAEGQFQDIGTAYVFARQGSAWNEIHNLLPTGAKPGARAGFSMAMSQDGQDVILGAPFDDGETFGTGSAYVLGTSLAADRLTASISGGDFVKFSLWAGNEPGNENQLYIVLGSVSGSCHGLFADGNFLPLNFDYYTTHSLSVPNSPPLVSSSGNLDASAQSTSGFQGTILPPVFIGLDVQHAFVVLNSTGPLISHVSNAVEFELTH